METIKLVYIDDTPDNDLSKYLDRYSSNDYQFESSEIEFDPTQDYNSLLCNPEVQSANIIIIDSRLFENKTVTGGKFTGEEFKLVLKKFYPFIEFLLIK